MRNAYILYSLTFIVNGHQVLQSSSVARLAANHAWSTIAWPLSDLAFQTEEAKSKLAPSLSTQVTAGYSIHRTRSQPHQCVSSLSGLRESWREHRGTF